MNPAVFRLGKLLFILAFVWHLIGCSYWFVSYLENFAGDDPYFAIDGGNMWVPSPEQWCTSEDRLANVTACLRLPVECFNSNEWFCPSPLSHQYANSFFWAVMATTGIGRNIQPVT